jgi:multiple sugar transport system ATP-binding protein
MSLADRIVVMYQGKIEQIGTPAEVYRNSATRFVASFIGTPPTNFFTGRVKKTGQDLCAECSGFSYRIPAPQTAALTPYEGKEVVLGIRPESLRISPALERGESWICDGRVDFTEPQGSYSVLITHIGGEEIKIVSSDFTDLPLNTQVALSVKEAMFFDPASGLRIPVLRS